jgi:hypothetical protein
LLSLEGEKQVKMQNMDEVEKEKEQVLQVKRLHLI